MSNFIVSVRATTARHTGKACTPVRAVTVDDGEAFDPNVAKTVVKLDDGTEVVCLNDEIRG